MINNKHFISFSFVLILGLFMLAVPQNGYSAPVPQGLGCCGSPGDSCIVCEEGDCAFLEDECNQQGAAFFLEGSVCNAEIISCTDNFKENGCCVLSRASCNDDQSIGACNEANGIGWYLQTSCSEVPDCDPIVRNIPTLSVWGVVALIAVLGIIGFVFMRRRYQTN